MSKIKELLESTDFESHVTEFVKELIATKQRQHHQTKRIDHLTIDFDSLVQRSIDKHHTRIIDILFHIAEHRGIVIEPIDTFTAKFPSEIYEYKGWQFAIINGQGTTLSIYKNNVCEYST
jgi:hypothetical protein